MALKLMLPVMTIGFVAVPLPGDDINTDGARLRNTIKDILY